MTNYQVHVEIAKKGDRWHWRVCLLQNTHVEATLKGNSPNPDSARQAACSAAANLIFRPDEQVEYLRKRGAA